LRRFDATAKIVAAMDPIDMRMLDFPDRHEENYLQTSSGKIFCYRQALEDAFILLTHAPSSYTSFCESR